MKTKTTKTTLPETTTNRAYHPQRAVRLLNQHCRAGNGFYASVLGGRYFRARTVAGGLQVSDWVTWFPVTEEQAVFHDSWGHNIPLY